MRPQPQRRRVFIQDGDDGDWLEVVNGDNVRATDADVEAAEADGDYVIRIVYADGEDWRLPVG